MNMSQSQVHHAQLQQLKQQDQVIQAATSLFPHSKIFEPMDQLDWERMAAELTPKDLEDKPLAF